MTIEDLFAIVTMVCTVTGELTIVCLALFYLWN